MFRPIAEKRILPREEIGRAAAYFRTGKVLRAALIRKGVINTNYVLRTKKGRFLLRLYNLSSLESVKDELQLLQHLTERGLRVPQPRKGKRGHVLAFDSFPLCCFHYIEGKKPVTTAALIKEVGALTGDLHNLTAAYGASYRKEGEGVLPMLRLAEEAREALLRGGFKDAEGFLASIAAGMSEIRFPRSLPEGIIHVDIKEENVLRDRHGALALIDFDNSYRDKLINDVGSCLMWWCMARERLDMSSAGAFLKGYEGRRRLSREERMNIIPAFEFNLLKQALKYAYICLPRKEFAEKKAYYFLRCYQNVKREEKRLAEAFSA